VAGRGTLRRSGRLLVSALLLCLVTTALPAAAEASPGTIAGQVTDAHGPVAGAQVALVPDNGWTSPHTVSAADGSYAITAPPGTYSLGATPPDKSSDGYFEQQQVVVNDGATTTVNPTLPGSQSTGSLSGVASYPDHAPDGGVQVYVNPAHPSGSFKHRTVFTDDDGHWDAGSIPAGTYQLVFVVDVNNTATTEASQYVSLGGGAEKSIATTLDGPRPGGTLVGVARTTDGLGAFLATVTLKPSSGGGAQAQAFADGDGNYHVSAPPGTYDVTVEDPGFDGGTTTEAATLTAGHLSRVNYTVPPLPVPAGIVGRRSAEDVGFLNAERARWGLPAGIAEIPSWSQACGAHDAYLRAIGMLQHEEDSGMPGYSPGGAWAGGHSVLSVGYDWTAAANPWEDAPIHLNQLMAPDLSAVGIDESGGYACATTWPGILRTPPPVGTVTTYPGDGTQGLPPAEYAAESPFVPGEMVGITGLAGRELFVYEEGTGYGTDLSIASATLRSASGPVDIRWVDQTTRKVGGFLAGGIIIPVAPLAANTRYTASVTLEAGADYIPRTSHTWSFTTGPPNPGGVFPGAKSAPVDGPATRPAARPSLKLRRVGRKVRIAGRHFRKGTVTLRRRGHSKALKRVKVEAGGAFVTRARLGRRRMTIVAREKSLYATATIAAAPRSRKR
jgi:hypothetical protein